MVPVTRNVVALLGVSLGVAALGLAAPALAKTAVDPRPLPPLTTNAVPAYPSLSAFLDAARVHRLTTGPATGPFDGSRLPGAVSEGYAARSASSAMRSTVTRHASTQPALSRWQPAANGTARWLEGRLGSVAGYAPAGGTGLFAGAVPPGDLPSQALAVLRPWAGRLGLTDPSGELHLRSQQTDALGWTHLRYDQVYQGVPVWGRDLYVHIDPAGMVRIVNGAYDPTPQGVDTVPTETADAALAATQADLTAKGRWSPAPQEVQSLLGYEPARQRLVIDTLDGAPRLAWEVTVRPNLIEQWQYLVDARTGAVLARIPLYCDATFQDATGTDLNAKSRSFRTWKDDQNTSYLLWDTANFNAAGSTLPDTMAGGIMTLDLRNQDLTQNANIYPVTSTNNTWSDPSAVSAHDNAKAAYDYYRNTFTRKAIDDKDSTIISVIHVTQDGQPMDNAFWNGKAMFYGDGNTAFKPLAGGLDVAAHEMSHGVIGNSAGLKYEYQSGALNESFADVFACFVDRDDYLIGEDVMQPGEGIALRDLENPADPQVLAEQPATMAGYVNTTSDNGGVHTNSGIPNHAAALIMKAIGRDKAEKIYYRALTTYLTATSQFIDCRNAVEQATKDLYPNGTAELSAVQSAFDTVGIKAATTPPPGGGGGDKIPPVTGGTPYITFAKDDGSIGYMDPDAGSVWVFNDASAKARVTTANNIEDRAQLSTPLDGSAIWFANQSGELAFVQTSDGAVYHYPNLNLNQPNDIWNASVSPDGTYIALVSANRTDRSLYILDLNSGWLGRITLEPETTQSDIKDTSILYPDVVSWSPNSGYPRIGFDALHHITVNNAPVEYWGVGEINFGAGRIYDLIPGQPTDMAIGNITYSNTDPNFLALNYWETFYGITIIDVELYEAGYIQFLNLSDYMVGTLTIDDPLRPTFAPDDKRLAVSVPSHDLLCLYTLADKSMSAWTMPFTIYNPRWFVVGGSVPYTFADAARAVEVASGLSTMKDTDMARLDLVKSGTSGNRILLDDAAYIARKVTGLAP